MIRRNDPRIGKVPAKKKKKASPLKTSGISSKKSVSRKAAPKAKTKK
jgi:hypothetical protein